MYYQVPLDNNNSTLSFKVTLENKNAHIKLILQYQDILEYWTAEVWDADEDECLITCLPLVTGCNLLEQYAYLGIGEAYVYRTEPSKLPHPDNETLDTTFILLWGDSTDE